MGGGVCTGGGACTGGGGGVGASGAGTGSDADGCVCGTGITAPDIGVPHNEQNFLPALSSPPHCLHARGAAHFEQNFFPCVTGAPQL